MKKLSIILLYYNQSQYMEKLFKSIKYANIPCEIIVIDDCSTELFPFEKVKKIIPNIEIKLIRNKSNTKNQSLCRNIGIKNSTGDYLTYIDGDDYYNSYELSQLYKNIKDNDIYLTTIITQERFNKNHFQIRNMDIKMDYPSICIAQHIAKKSYIINNNLWWDEKKYYWDAEDLYYGIYVLTKTQDIKCIDKYFYFHKKLDNSNSDRKDKDLFNYIIYLLDMYEDVKKLPNIKYFSVFEKVVELTTNNIKLMEF